MKIEKAIRKSLPANICLYGETSSGKTLTALKLAHGLINQGERVCVIDTENHRASHYDVDFDFDVINLEAPFSPEKFIEAINIIQNGGYKAIIIDSISHEWDGFGGVIHTAENSQDKGLLAWGKPKKAHKKLMDCILSSKAHIICCAKAKDKLKQVKDVKTGKSEIIPKGFLPIQEATFMYDMLLNIRMVKNGEFKIMKCPKNLDLKINEKTKYLDESHGKRIAEWIKQGQSLDMDFLKLQKEARLLAMEGEDIFKDWFAKLSVEKQNLFSNDFKKELMAIYKNVDTDNAGEEVVIEKASKLFIPAKAPVETVEVSKEIDEPKVEPAKQVKKPVVEVKQIAPETQKDIDYIKSFIAQNKLTSIQEVHNLILKNSAIKNKQLAEPKNLEKFKQFLHKSVDILV